MALHNAKHSKKSSRTSARRSDKPRASAEAVADRSAAVAKSWGNKKVAAARSKKDKVKVGGTEYRSVLAAFEELKLPVEKHIAFRAELKAAGRKIFTEENGTKHTFTIVQA